MQTLTMVQLDDGATVVSVDGAPPIVACCAECRATVAPDGVCLEVGSCSIADGRATRGAARQTAKYAVPAAWNARGSVD